MKVLVERLNSKLQKYGIYRAVLIPGTLSDSIIITAGNTKKFLIEKYLFGGYEVTYYDFIMTDSKIVLELTNDQEGAAEILLWHMIEKFIIADETSAFNTVSELIQDLQKVKTVDDVQEFYDENQGSNFHDGNALLLALNYGTEDDVKNVKKAMITNMLVNEGYVDLYPFHKRLYPKFQAALNRANKSGHRDKGD